MKIRIVALALVAVSVLLALFAFNQDTEAQFPFKFGLDLVGGSHLVYSADTSELEWFEVDESMQALVTVLERRLNPNGTSEVQIRTEGASVFAENSSSEERVIIEIPNVTDPEEAKSLIGQIPLLEFKFQKSPEEIDALIESASGSSTIQELITSGVIDETDLYNDTGLTGRYVEQATVVRDQYTNQPVVSLQFNGEGGQLFADLTENNVGEIMAIILDGVVVSDPVIQTAIYGGTAQISGQFTIDEANELARNLNFGALPVPIELISTQTISQSLGDGVLTGGIKSAFFGLLVVMVFLILVYRFGGVIASVSLTMYVILLLSLFKFFGFVFTAAGIAGFIISIGMAVDANILIFERIREELSNGKTIRDAIVTGFDRAWLSIRDSNLSSIITAIILFYATTSLVQGFALAFGLGVIVSMFTAITITRTLLLAATPRDIKDKTWRKRFRSLLVGSLIKQS